MAAAEGSAGAGVARDSVSVAAWTSFSRVTGFARAVTIAAVLGPTYLGNTYQAINGLPNLLFDFLIGNLFATLLVPALVRSVDRGERPAIDRLAGGFLGLSVLVFILVAVLAMLGGQLLLDLITVGVEDPAVAEGQQRVGVLLLLFVMPQVVLYAVAGVGGAVMNAHGRFALAAAAPAFENLGVIATLVAMVVVFGSGTTLESVGTTEVLLLGLGSTTAVGLHASVQWAGARAVGVRLVPRRGWRDPEVRAVVRRAVPSLGYSGLSALRWFAVVVVANSVSGGVVAFTLALNLFYLPIALGARPVAVALLPRLSRLSQAGSLARFGDESVRGAALVLFLTVPAAVGYLVLSVPLARAVAFGEMASVEGVGLLAASLSALALGVIGEAAFLVATHAAYARDDARSPFVAMALRTSISLAGMLITVLLFEGVAVLVALGIALSLADVTSAVHLTRRVRSALPGGRERMLPPLLRALTASAVMVGPAYAVATGLAAPYSGHASDVVAIIVAALVGGAGFLAVQRALGSPELVLLLAGLRKRRA